MSRKIRTVEEVNVEKGEALSKDLLRLKDEQKLMLSRIDFDHFVEYVLLDEHGRHIKQSEIHRSWTKFIEDCWVDRVNPGILAPWGHGKSVQQSIGRCLFELGLNMNVRTKIVCNSASNAEKRVSTLKNYIEQSKRLKKVFPHVVPGFDHWTSTSINIQGRLFSDIDHSVESYGIESRAVGGRADLLIFDDVVDDKSEKSAAHRKMTIDNFENVFMSRLEPTGRVILIGTMWHTDDLHCNLLGKAGWRFLIQGVAEDFSCIEEIIV